MNDAFLSWTLLGSSILDTGTRGLKDWWSVNEDGKGTHRAGRMEQTQPDSGDVEIAAAAAAAIDAADEGNAADPPRPEQGREDELAEAAPAGSVEALLQQIFAGQQLHQQQILALQKQQQQQQPVPQQQQQLHAPPAGALLAQPAGGIIPHPASAPANPSKSAAGKLTEKRMAEL